MRRLPDMSDVMEFRPMPWCIHAIGRIYSPHVRNRMPDGTIPLAVAEPYPTTALERVRAAWWVLTGKAYAFAWPKPGDLERATGERIPRPNGPGCASGEASTIGMIAGARPPSTAEALAAKQECIDYWGDRAGRAEVEAARLRRELDSLLDVQRRG